MGKFHHRPPAQSRRTNTKGNAMSGNGRLIQPNAVNVETTFVEGPLAQPCAVTLQGSAGIKLLAVGGLTKVEALAGQIAGGWVAQANLSQAKVEEQIAEISVHMAERILSECASRRQPAETAQ
jgi:hypothetical protein